MRFLCITLRIAVLVTIGLIAMCTRPLQAQTQQPGYAIVCRPRAEFVAQLRTLVPEPGLLELDLTRFSVVATLDVRASHSEWTLVVTRSDAECEGARIVRDATCEAVADAAAIVVSAWIFEAPPSRPTLARVGAPPVPLVAASAEAPAIGVSLAADGALRLDDDASLGTSFELWRLSASGRLRHNIGVRWWVTHPTTRRVPAFFTSLSGPFVPDEMSVSGSTENTYIYDDTSSRPWVELAYTLDWYALRLDAVGFGLSLAAALGWRAELAGIASTTLRASAGVTVAWVMKDPLSLWLRVGGGTEGKTLIPYATLGFALRL